MNFNKLSKLWYILLLTPLFFVTSCGSDDPVPTPVASFQFATDTDNFLIINFTNFSQNADSYIWDFGDNAGTSTDKDPSYTYSETGTYTVKLTAVASDGTAAEKTESVTVSDPLEAQRLLIGSSGKTWQLLGDNSTGVNPLQVGPNDRSQVWFSIANLCSRECIFDDTWTFNTDGTYTYENNGDFWAEAGIWPTAMAETCFDANVASNFTGADGQDLSGWDSGTHGFVYDPTAETLTITGGFIGLTKAGTTADDLTAPAETVTYSVVKLVDAAVDTLVLETQITAADGYWAMTLVSYDNPADAVVVEECEPTNSTTISDVSIDFESNPPTWNVFGGPNSDGSGVVQTTVANPVSGGINTSAMVGQLDEPDGSQGWTGISTTLAGKIDFSTKQTFKVKVYSPFAGAVVKFKLEDSADANNNKEIDQTTTAADTWEELTFTFDATADTEKWDVLVLFFDFQAAAKSGARTHYFDDIILE